jgi:hypothetical protein
MKPDIEPDTGAQRRNREPDSPLSIAESLAVSLLALLPAVMFLVDWWTFRDQAVGDVLQLSLVERVSLMMAYLLAGGVLVATGGAATLRHALWRVITAWCIWLLFIAGTRVVRRGTGGTGDLRDLGVLFYQLVILSLLVQWQLTVYAGIREADAETQRLNTIDGVPLESIADESDALQRLGQAGWLLILTIGGLEWFGLQVIVMDADFWASASRGQGLLLVGLLVVAAALHGYVAQRRRKHQQWRRWVEKETMETEA